MYNVYADAWSRQHAVLIQMCDVDNGLGVYPDVFSTVFIQMCGVNSGLGVYPDVFCTQCLSRCVM